MNDIVYIIAFVGRKGSGKTTAAQYLVEKYGFHKVSFAKPLKDLVASLGVNKEGELLNPALKDFSMQKLIDYVITGLRNFEPNLPISHSVASIIAASIYHYYHSDNIEDRKRIARKLLQFIGTDVFRAWRSDYWVAKAIGMIQTLIKQGITKITIDDMRFPNEFQAILEFSDVYVVNDKIYNVFRYIVGIIGKTDNDEHPSETEVDKLIPKCHSIIHNTYDEKFFEHLDRLLEEVNIKVRNVETADGA